MMDERILRDFPIDWDEDNYVSRREFFKFVTLASGGLALGSAGIAAMSGLSRQVRHFDRVRVAAIGGLEVGGSLEFRYPRPHDLCILLRPAEDKLIAYSRRCTHLSCPVEYQHDQQRLYCPCHNGAFAVADGQVLQGPPPRPLPEILLEEADDGIYAVGVKL